VIPEKAREKRKERERASLKGSGSESVPGRVRESKLGKRGLKLTQLTRAYQHGLLGIHTK